jgi:hypothetical protein
MPFANKITATSAFLRRLMMQTQSADSSQRVSGPLDCIPMLFSQLHSIDVDVQTHEVGDLRQVIRQLELKSISIKSNLPIEGGSGRLLNAQTQKRLRLRTIY